MNKTYLRGDMYYADLGRGIGSEQEGYRPVLIIQNDTGNKHSPRSLWQPYPAKWTPRPSCPLITFSKQRTAWSCLLWC